MGTWEERFHQAAMDYRSASVIRAPIAYAKLIELVVIPNWFQKEAIQWLQGELSNYDFPPNGHEDMLRNSLQALCVQLLKVCE